MLRWPALFTASIESLGSHQSAQSVNSERCIIGTDNPRAEYTYPILNPEKSKEISKEVNILYFSYLFIHDTITYINNRYIYIYL